VRTNLDIYPLVGLYITVLQTVNILSFFLSSAKSHRSNSQRLSQIVQLSICTSRTSIPRATFNSLFLFYYPPKVTDQAVLVKSERSTFNMHASDQYPSCNTVRQSVNYIATIIRQLVILSNFVPIKKNIKHTGCHSPIIQCSSVRYLGALVVLNSIKK